MKFPTVLRKMWSGGEVQAWLDRELAWRPMETAPRDGTVILADTDAGVTTVCWWACAGYPGGGDWTLVVNSDHAQNDGFTRVRGWLPAPAGASA